MDDHRGRDCSQSSMACLCAKYPRHLVDECSIVCRWCFYTPCARHPAMTCDIRCCMCNQHLSAEHRHESCRLLGDASTRMACHDRQCHLCNGPHLPQDCENRLCAVEGCCFWARPCTSHCTECRWNIRKDKVCFMVLNILHGNPDDRGPCYGEWHQMFCRQWKSQLLVDEQSGLMVWHLICRMNRNHLSVLAHELDGICEKTRTRLEEKLSNWLQASNRAGPCPWGSAMHASRMQPIMGTAFSKMEPESMRSKDQAYHDLFVVLLRGAASELDVTVFEWH